MAEWVLVENNQILEYHDLLPKSWKNHSGLNLSADNLDFLKSLGWYKVNKSDVVYDPAFTRLLGYQYHLENDQIYERPILEQITDQERIASIEYNRNLFLTDLRNQRDIRLKDTDFTQLPDFNERLTDENRIQWKNYRQSLRDLPSLYQEPKEIQWPQIPSVIFQQTNINQDSSPEQQSTQ